MTMRPILLMYVFPHHHSLVERLASELALRGVFIDILCVRNYTFSQRTDVNIGKINSILIRVMYGNSKSLIKRICRHFLQNPLLRRMVSKYKLVDFHSYYPVFYSVMKYCSKQDIRYDITLWGSDILRSSDKKVEQDRLGFERCHYIKGVDNTLAAVSKHYNGAFDAKQRKVYFGNSDFEVIDRLSEEDIRTIKRRLFVDSEGKTVVALGYNGIAKQNHKSMLESIDSLPDEIKMRCYFIIPMTYGGTPEYISEIRLMATRIGISYILLDNYLTSEEIAVLRMITDVAINFQDTDAFAGSIKDHLYCEKVMILGEWLDYPLLDSTKIYYLKASVDNLPEIMVKVINDLEHYLQLCKGNRKKLHSISSWDSVVNGWFNTYVNE